MMNEPFDLIKDIRIIVDNLTESEAKMIYNMQEAFDLIKDIRNWDHLATAADGPYWISKIDSLMDRIS